MLFGYLQLKQRVLLLFHYTSQMFKNAQAIAGGRLNSIQKKRRKIVEKLQKHFMSVCVQSQPTWPRFLLTTCCQTSFGAVRSKNPQVERVTFPKGPDSPLPEGTHQNRRVVSYLSSLWWFAYVCTTFVQIFSTVFWNSLKKSIVVLGLRFGSLFLSNLSVVHE